jgi:hypothetical protein
MYPLDCTSALIEGILLKNHTLHSRHMSYKLRRFGSDRLIIRDTLLEEKCAILASTGGIFLKIVTSHSPRMWYKQLKFGCDLSLHTGSLLRTEFVSSAVPQNSIEEIFLQFRTANPPCMHYKWCKRCCEWSITEEQCTFSAASRLLWEGFFWNFAFWTHCICAKCCQFG